MALSATAIWIGKMPLRLRVYGLSVGDPLAFPTAIAASLVESTGLPSRHFNELDGVGLPRHVPTVSERADASESLACHFGPNSTGTT